MRYTKILTPDSSKPKTLYLTTMGIAIIVLRYLSSETILKQNGKASTERFPVGDDILVRG
jgi:hypothetical protein